MKEGPMKPPVSHDKIYKIMLGVTFGVTIGFFLINVIRGNVLAMTVIGICLFVLTSAHFIMKKQKVSAMRREFALSVGLCFLVSVISLFSGESYSDDFLLFLAVIGMTGLYLEPKFTKIQIVEGNVLLFVMAMIHPEKVGEVGQFILCQVCFTLAATLFYQTIKRGRAFIRESQERANRAEELLVSLRQMGDDLENDFKTSSIKIENSTMGLEKGSVSIAKGADNMFASCHEVHDKIVVSQQQIEELNKEVKGFEHVLLENQDNIGLMTQQLNSVSGIVCEANEVFQEMKEQMATIAKIAEELNTISFKVTLLSLNASIESARAGEAGVGFDVVASEMRQLSSGSDMFSKQVSEVVAEMLERVDTTAQQFEDSKEAIAKSEEFMRELKDSFDKLTKQFDEVYENIEEQNHNVREVDAIFGDLEKHVFDVHHYSVENQNAVQEIIEAMELYKKNISKVIDDTKSV